MKKTIFLVVVCFTTIIFTNCKKGGGTGCADGFIARGDTGYIALPTAFIPNDTPVNRLFRIAKLRTDSFALFNLSVYKLSGAMVFQTSYASVGWDGKDLAGKMCTDYEYLVKLKYTTIGGKSVDTCSHVYMLSRDWTGGCITSRSSDTLNYRFGDGFDPITGTYAYNTVELPYCRQ